MRPRILAPALVVLALVAAACGGGGGGGGGTTTPPQETTASPTETGGAFSGTLVMHDNTFDPNTFEVASGTEVEIENEGAALHNFSITEVDIDIDVQAGETGTAHLELDPGTYDFFCEYHKSLGMTGTLTIT
jgi:plastocyanin